MFEISNMRLFIDIVNVVKLEAILFPVSRGRDLKSSLRHLMNRIIKIICTRSENLGNSIKDNSENLLFGNIFYDRVPK